MRPFLAIVLLVATSVQAHDGGFGHSRRTLFASATVDGFSIEYRIVMNRDEALVETTRMDADGDGKVSDAEKEKYLAAKGRRLAGLLSVRTMTDEKLSLEYAGYELHQALVQTYRFTLTTKAREVLLDDRAFPHKPGLLQLRAGTDASIEQVRPVDLSHAERVSIRITRAKR